MVCKQSKKKYRTQLKDVNYYQKEKIDEIKEVENKQPEPFKKQVVKSVLAMNNTLKGPAKNSSSFESLTNSISFTIFQNFVKSCKSTQDK